LADRPDPRSARSPLGASYTEMGARLQAAICERFGLPPSSPPMLKEVDRALLATERRAVSCEAWPWPELEGVEPLDLEIEPWLPQRAYEEYIARYERLAAAR